MGLSENDKKLAKTLISKGIMSQDKAKELLKKQKLLTVRNKANKTFADIVVEEGYLSKKELDKHLPTCKIEGTRIGGYKIIKKIGNGGMGTVYKANQLSMNREVALKLLTREQTGSQKFIKRFYREAHMAARLTHNNIVTAIDVGEDKGHHYFAMELVKGLPLSDVMKSHDGPLPEKYALHVTRQVVLGLLHATEHGIIHRDIKPDNLLLTHLNPQTTGSYGTTEDVVKIVDLGIAKLNDQNMTILTMEGMALGTPHYLSPEQAKGESDIDFRADIYGLGATLFHMVTGETPFSGSSTMQIVAAHVNEELRPPQSINNELSNGCNDLIMNMMHKVKSKRFASLQELLDQIDKATSNKEPVKKNLPLWAKSVGVAALCLMAMTVWAMKQKGGNQKSPPNNHSAKHQSIQKNPTHDEDQKYIDTHNWLRSLNSPRFTDLTLDDIKTSTDFNFSGIEFGDTDLSPLNNLNQIEQLNFEGCDIDDKDLESLKTLSNLKYLNINETHASSSCFKETISFFNLKELRASHLPCNPSIIEILGLMNLEVLEIGFMTKSESTMSLMSRLKTLKTFYCHNCMLMKQESTRFFYDMPNLKEIHLEKASNVRITGLKKKCAFTHANTLTLTETKIGKLALLQLKLIKHLKHLDISDNEVLEDTDLALLQSFRKLETLNVSGIKASAKTIKELKNKLPNCKIIH